MRRRLRGGGRHAGVVVGAQVSYRDRENFGRRHMDVEAGVLTEWVAEQVEVLHRDRGGVRDEVAYLKPHGALYNRVVDDEEQAAAVLPGAGRCRCSGCPARRSCGWRRRTGAPACARGSRTGATPRRAGWCPATSRARWSRAPRPSRPTRSRWRGPARCGRCACTVTRPGAVEAAQAVRAALAEAGYDVRPWCRAEILGRVCPAGVGLSTGSCGRRVDNRPCLWTTRAQSVGEAAVRRKWSEQLRKLLLCRLGCRVEISHRSPQGSRGTG